MHLYHFVAKLVVRALASVVASIIVLFSIISADIASKFYYHKPEVETNIDIQEFENCFKDSGY